MMTMDRIILIIFHHYPHFHDDKVQASPCKVIAAGPSTVWCLDLDNHCQVSYDRLTMHTYNM